MARERRIKMLGLIAGPEGTFVQNQVAVVGKDISETLAAALLDKNYAEEVKEKGTTRPLEAAAIEPPETTAKKPAAKRKKSGG